MGRHRDAAAHTDAFRPRELLLCDKQGGGNTGQKPARKTHCSWAFAGLHRASRHTARAGPWTRTCWLAEAGLLLQPCALLRRACCRCFSLCGRAAAAACCSASHSNAAAIPRRLAQRAQQAGTQRRCGRCACWQHWRPQRRPQQGLSSSPCRLLRCRLRLLLRCCSREGHWCGGRAC